MQFTHEHHEIQKTLKRYIDAEINPHVEEWEEAEKECYGLIEGANYGDRGAGPGGAGDLMPTRIILFQKTIEDDHDQQAELIKCIQETILHEIGHWFGEDEDDLERLGLG